MTTNNIKRPFLWILAAVAIAGLASASASAFPWFGGLFGSGHGFGKTNTSNQDIQSALQNHDYAGYLSALDAHWQAYRATITQDAFDKLSSNYQNKTAKLQAFQATQAAINQAIADGSYSEWQTAIAGLNPQPPFASKINASNFPTYVQYVSALKNKDFAIAKTLASQLGITRGWGGGFGMRGGMGMGSWGSRGRKSG